MNRSLRVLLTVTALLIPAQAFAQNISLRGRGTADQDAYLRDLLRTRDYLLITRDTVITRADTVRGDVVVVGATLRLDGVIDGDLHGVGANLFIRPSAKVNGATRNTAGGLYPSELATLAGSVNNDPGAPYLISNTADGIVIRGTENPSPLVLDDFMGFAIPTYDRVNGVTLRAGGGLLLPRLGRVEPIVRGWGSYYSQRGDFGYGGELGIKRHNTSVAFGGERTTLTNEEWLRSDLSNSISYLVREKDYRTYYAADRYYARVDRVLERASRLTTVALIGQVEDASPLRAASPWTIFSADSVRPNDYGEASPGVRRLPAGRITSAILNATSEWVRPTHAAELDGLVEVGTDLIDGESEFARYAVSAAWAMKAIANHTLAIEGRFQGPLPGTDSLPYQRWTHMGGSGTLPTFQIAAFPGDRLAFTETRYSIPLPAWSALPMLGTARFEILHAIGMAWSRDIDPGFEQNVGLRLAYRLGYVRAMVDPGADEKKVKVSFGVTFPKGAYPWEE